jgi:hypothetical protein
MGNMQAIWIVMKLLEGSFYRKKKVDFCCRERETKKGKAKRGRERAI